MRIYLFVKLNVRGSGASINISLFYTICYLDYLFYLFCATIVGVFTMDEKMVVMEWLLKRWRKIWLLKRWRMICDNFEKSCDEDLKEEVKKIVDEGDVVEVCM